MMQTAFQARSRLLATVLAGVASAGLVTTTTAAEVGAGATSAPISPSGNAQRQNDATRDAVRVLEREGTSVGGAEAAAAAGIETEGQAAAEAKRPAPR